MTLYPRTEPLNVNMPKTYFGRKPEDLTHGLGWVRACPIYQVPSSPGSTRPEVGEYAFSCYVVETFGNDMVKVRFDWDGVPGQREQIVYPHEIHAPKCQCRACKTDHIYNVD
ncbi:hypothetical protein FDA94_28695 [Herbidospora galbida]|uniref:Uncharacterized protein n=1 Tax=Herbidospora galbida TaxID=2575442 RepID=A0A4U3M7U3_9ACTN|nr:hypothetical protein [Herbidospora galbida]TKK84610.1 hypothetical protein FDA94_28695 [Herbidospora galbida]